MVAFPCSTFSIARFFDASSGDPSKARGPKPVRDADFRDGLPPNKLDPKHAKELRYSNLLLDRTVRVKAW